MAAVAALLRLEAVALPPAVDLTKQGDIEYWQGKDTVRQHQESDQAVQRLASPAGRSRFKELPDNADQQRQQMIQNTQIKNAKMG